jgi:DNA-binding NarL/FixJ family response regulator
MWSGDMTDRQVAEGEKTDVIRLLMADDQAEFLDAVCDDLECDPRFSVVGRARDGIEACALCRETEPDVAILDIQMPNVDGIAAAKIIHSEMPHVKLVMLTLFDDDTYVARLMQLGISGYLLKADSADSDKLARAIVAAYEGDGVLDRQVIDKLGSLINVPSPTQELTRSEMHVAVMVANGAYNKDIARKLSISYGHARNLVSQLYKKLGVNTRGEVAQKLVESGYYDMRRTR